MKKSPCKREENKHAYYCECLQCETKKAFCTCSECILRRTGYSGRSSTDRDYSKNPSLQQLVDLENKGGK